MRFLSGIQPSGKLHLGNYFGAIKQYLELQDKGEGLYFIADLHALTSVQNGDKLREMTLDVAIDYLALGLDPKKSILFLQSDIPEVTELAWILSTVTGMGLLERCHAYKDKVSKGLKASAGLFTYPILMAADILIYRSDAVPVGEDQAQHIEVAQDIAQSFNAVYGPILKRPEAKISPAARVPGTDGRKMSKSYGNTIEIFAEGGSLKKAVMGIVTDSKAVSDPKDPDKCNVFALYRLMASPAEIEELRSKYLAGGMGYGEAKNMLLAKIDATFAQFREARKKLAADRGYVLSVLKEGAAKARAIAAETMADVRKAVGISP